MNSEQITAFLQEHWSWVTLIIGAVLLIGFNWGDPQLELALRPHRQAGLPPLWPRLPAGDILLAGDRADCDQCYVLDVVRRPKR